MIKVFRIHSLSLSRRDRWLRILYGGADTHRKKVTHRSNNLLFEVEESSSVIAAIVKFVVPV